MGIFTPIPKAKAAWYNPIKKVYTEKVKVLRPKSTAKSGKVMSNI